MKLNSTKNSRKARHNFMSLTLFLLLHSSFFIFGQNNFDTSKDILIAQFDNYPDSDDIHTQAALGSLLAHNEYSEVNYLCVAGAYGTQPSNSSWVYTDSSEVFEIAFGDKDINWIDAHEDFIATGNRNNSASFIKDKVKPILEDGGKVWVMEAGQSDITRDWVEALINDGITNTDTNIIVVQHSSWNENQTTDEDLTYVQNNTNYVQVDDGNSDYGTGTDRGDNTPNYKDADTVFLEEVIGDNNPNETTKNIWSVAKIAADNSVYVGDRVIQNGGVDFSDTVEAMWIFDLSDESAGYTTVRDFWDAFIVNTVECDSEVREEVDGIVIIEAENTSSDLGEWFKDTDVSDFTGNGYIEFNGNRPENGDPNSPLTYQFKINEAGLYNLHLRCARETLTINNEERDDVANDCFVRVEGDYTEGPNAGDNHGDDAPLESLKSDTKFFGGNDFEFVWASGNRLDLGGETNKRRAVYNFKANETYTLVVSGRSQFFKLDRLVFRKETVNSNTAQNTTLTESFEDCDNNSNNNIAPVVEITTPSNEADFLLGENIAINANAFDTDGSIDQVEFFVDNQSIGIQRVPEYNESLTNYGVGSYTIIAIATDNEGATTTSDSVTINIVNTLSINDNITDAELSEIKVYPNPVSELVYIESKNTIQHIELFTSKAQRIKKSILNNNTFDVSDIPVGLYFIKMYTENEQIIIKKIVKK